MGLPHVLLTLAYAQNGELGFAACAFYDSFSGYAEGMSVRQPGDQAARSADVPWFVRFDQRLEGKISMTEPQATKKAMNKTEVLNALADSTGLTKQQVDGLLDELAKLIKKNLGDEGPGVFAIPGLLQIKVVRKPAVPEHKGINPFTKEEMVFKAKPAKNAVKLVALKGLKSMV